MVVGGVLEGVDAAGMKQLDGRETSGKHTLQTSAGYLSVVPLPAHLLMRQDK